MEPMHKKNTLTAAPATLEMAYAERKAMVKELLGRCSLALAAHEQAASLQPKNWGFLGDLDPVCGNLIQALGMLNGLTAEERDRYKF